MIPWSLDRTVDPIIPVVPLHELKHHLRVTWDDENDAIEDYGLAAELAVEGELSAAGAEQTWVLRLDYFPSWEIHLPRPPLMSVTTVQYVDVNGATQVLAGTVYTVDAPPTNSRWTSKPGRIHLAYNQVWPTTRDIPNAVIVTYKAGKATGEAVDERVRTAIKLCAADMYQHRERERGTAALRAGATDFYEALMANCRCVHEFNYR